MVYCRGMEEGRGERGKMKSDDASSPRGVHRPLPGATQGPGRFTLTQLLHSLVGTTRALSVATRLQSKFRHKRAHVPQWI